MHTPERPTATIPEVFALAGAVQPRYRALVLLAAFCGLRWGELMGLRRQDIDTDAGTVRVRGAVSELNSGKRTVAVPRSVLPAVVLHLDLYAEQGAHGRVFVGPKGATPRRNHFGGLWRKACAETGVKGLHFHDLRHTGNTLASRTDASTRELMIRLGHGSSRAALIYQHGSQARERQIADAVDAMIVKALKRGSGRNGHVRGTDG